MAVRSSAITNTARVNMAYALLNQNDSSYDYVCMGVGNASQPADPSDTGLVGDETKYVTVNGVYEADYTAKWTHTWSYDDLPSHKFGEAGIFKNESELEMLGRIVFDPIELNESDYIEITMRVRFP